MKRLLIFLGITFFLTWSLEFGLMAAGGLSTSYAIMVLSLVMLIPALSVIITRLITKEGFKDLRLKPHFKGNIRYYLMAWFGPAFLILLGAIIYFLIFPSNFDPTLSHMVDIFQANGGNLTGSAFTSFIILQFVMGILLAPLLNIITTSGEEMGWRGYLLPKLQEHVSLPNAVLISGVIWGIWHAPIIALGHNYGLGYPFFPWGGILAMIVFCVFVGSFFSFLAVRTRSFLPAAIAHGSLNGFAAISLIFTKGTTSPFIGPLPVGIIGGIGFIVVGTTCFVIMSRTPTPSTIIEETILDQ